MTTREFDPVLSAALRNELEALATRGPASRRPALRDPQIWITAVTAVVLVLATIGVLQLTSGRHAVPAHGGHPSRVVTDASPVPLTLLPWPTGIALANERLLARHRSTTDDRVTGRMATAAHSLLVVVSCRGTGTLTISTQDGFRAGSPTDAPSASFCRGDTVFAAGYGDSEQGGMEHYGRMRYVIQPTGRVSWTVSFYDAG